MKELAKAMKGGEPSASTSGFGGTSMSTVARETDTTVEGFEIQLLATSMLLPDLETREAKLLKIPTTEDKDVDGLPLDPSTKSVSFPQFGTTRTLNWHHSTLNWYQYNLNLIPLEP